MTVCEKKNSIYYEFFFFFQYFLDFPKESVKSLSHGAKCIVLFLACNMAAMPICMPMPILYKPVFCDTLIKRICIYFGT